MLLPRPQRKSQLPIRRVTFTANSIIRENTDSVPGIEGIRSGSPFGGGKYDYIFLFLMHPALILLTFLKSEGILRVEGTTFPHKHPLKTDSSSYGAHLHSCAHGASRGQQSSEWTCIFFLFCIFQSSVIISLRTVSFPLTRKPFSGNLIFFLVRKELQHNKLCTQNRHGHCHGHYGGKIPSSTQSPHG